MTEEHLVKIWAKEFDEKYFHSAQIKLDNDSSKYKVRDNPWGREAESLCVKFNNMLDVWIEAKRLMSAIELPEVFDDPDGCQLFSGSVTGAITAAGYKYKIK